MSQSNQRFCGRYFRLLDRVIPKLITLDINNTTEFVILGICPKAWCCLPNEGLFVLEVRQTPDTASASLPVFISPTGSVNATANNNNVPLITATGTPVTGAEVSAGNRYWVYFNKCDNIMQLMNFTRTTTTTTSTAS